MKLSFYLSFATAFCILSACSENTAPVPRLKLNYRYNLKSWPDKAYIASLDSVLKAEPVKKDTSSAGTEIAINTHRMPTFKLPASRRILTQSELDGNAAGKAAKKQTAGTAQTAAVQTAKVKTQTESAGAEAFADKFANALSNWQSDPTNVQLYKIVNADASEDLFHLLSRAYGKDATKLPRFFTLSSLQSVNPGVSVEHLKKGDAVRIPRL
jgi:hypothetical protein